MWRVGWRCSYPPSTARAYASFTVHLMKKNLMEAMSGPTRTRHGDAILVLNKRVIPLFGAHKVKTRAVHHTDEALALTLVDIQGLLADSR